MKVESLALSGAMLVTPRRFGDDRGFFSETYNQRAFTEAGIDADFVQDNHSRSEAVGTLRGLHYQAPPFAQSKLVRVVAGAIYDVIVDVRQGSPTFGQHVGVRLDAAGGAQLFVPRGFLHGFITLEPSTEVVYKVDNYYSAECDGSVLWNDPDLAIDWGESSSQPVLSAKDADAARFSDFNNPFQFEA